MPDSFTDHIPDALLDAYAATTVAYVEEHLLVCEECRARLIETERFVRAMREVLQEYSPRGQAEPQPDRTYSRTRCQAPLTSSAVSGNATSCC